MQIHDFLPEAETHRADLVSLRRDLHRRPERGLELPYTLDRVLAALEGLDLTIFRSETISSAVVRIEGGKPGPTIVLRADMDALALQEDTGLEFSSEIPVMMHACGHDLHAAIGVGAVRLLAAHREQLAGDVLFLFQPGEEGFGGAVRMLDEGALTHARSEIVGAYGLHVTTDKALGVFATKPGSLMAGSVTLDVTVRGRGGHGSAPHLALDANQVVAEIISGLQTMITRRFNAFDPVILTVGWIKGGEPGTSNVIPSSASFSATTRTFSEANREAIQVYSRELVENTAKAYGLEADVTFRPIMKPLLNDPEHAARAERVAVELFGEDRFDLMETPKAGGEDFADILLQAPGAFVFVGACAPELDPATAPYNHSNLVVFDDSVIPDAAAYLAALAIDCLAANPA